MTTLFSDENLQPDTSSLLQAPSSDAPGIGIAPPAAPVAAPAANAPYPGLGLAAPAATTPLQVKQELISKMSGGQKFFSALGDFGAALQGKTLPSDTLVKQQREDKMFKMQELQSSTTLLDHGLSMLQGTTGDERKTFAKAYADRLDAADPGMGKTFLAMADKPDLASQLMQYSANLPISLQMMLKTQPKEALKFIGTPEGMKVVESAMEVPVLNDATKKAQFVLGHWQQLVPPELVDELGKKTRLTMGDFTKINEAIQSNPDALAQKLAVPASAMNVIRKNEEAFYTPLGILTPKNEQAALLKQTETDATPNSPVAKAKADLTAGRITQAEYDGIVSKETSTDTQFMKEAAALYGKDTPEYKAAVKKHVERMDAPTSVMVNGGSDQVGLTPEAIDLFAQEAKKDRTVLTNLGRGVQGAKDLRAILNKMAENEKGGDGKGIAATRSEFRADSTSLNKMIPQYDAITAFENNAVKQGQVLTGLADKVDSTGVPVAERWIRAGRKSIAGDPDVSEFNAQIQLYRSEAAKILTNPNLTGVLTDSARHEVEGFLGADATAPQIKRVVKRLENDFSLRKQSIEGQIADIKSRQAGKPAAGAVPAANAKGWALHTDAKGNQAYVSPDGKQFEEVKK